MKGLLHSKRFRRNFYKWLSMYVGVMLLFTAVVTYSRYMSQFESSDKTKVARFEVGIKHKNCDNVEGVTCSSGTFRPKSEIEYNFEVDTTKLDVTADFWLTIIVHDDFQILGLKNMTTNEDIPISKNDRISVHDRILAGRGGLTDYKLTIMYKYNDKIEETTYDKPIVTIDYTAEQVN